MLIVPHGVYQVRDSYFIDFPDPYLKGNHNENRPHYFAFQDTKVPLLWLIPFSSQPGKLADYQRRIASGKSCDIFHPVHLAGRDGVLLIADMLPVTEHYIKGSFSISQVPVVFKDKSVTREIDRKARKVMALLRRGVQFTNTQPDIFMIEKKLIERLSK